MGKKGKMYLIPSPIAEGGGVVLPEPVIRTVSQLRYFLSENPRTTRRYFSSLKIFESIEPLSFGTIDKNTVPSDLDSLMQPLLNGNDMGLLSESGCPGIADPGALAVEFAHRNGIKVVPLIGPSSIVLSLMASGLNGQKFAFHGYLPIDQKEFTRTVKELEQESRVKHQTQMFIETPYRNEQLFSRLLKELTSSTSLCIASDISGTNEMIKTHSIADWHTKSVTLPKLPTMFLFLAK